MKLAAIGIVFFTLFSTGDSYFGQDSNAIVSNPDEVVQLYLNAIENGNRVQLAELTASVPEEYFLAKRLEVELYARLKGQSVDQSRITEIDSTNGFRLEKPDSSIRLIDDQGDTLRHKRLYIGRILASWAHSNEARVRVELRSRTSDSYSSNRDFLLTRIDNNWKVFLLESESAVSVFGSSTPLLSNNAQN